MNNKYRGKHIETGEWVYGYLIGDDVIVGEIVEFTDEYFCTEFWYKVDSDTVVQYTGIKDKKGQEIYEGDILQEGDRLGEVEWVQEQCSFMVYTQNPNWYFALEADAQLKDSEIVGNIHDNPELLAPKEGSDKHE